MGEALTNKTTTYTHKHSGETINETIRQLYAAYDGNLVLRVIRMHDTFVEHVDEVIIKNAQTGLIKFNETGDMFAYMIPQKNDKDEIIYMVNVIGKKDKDQKQDREDKNDDKDRDEPADEKWDCLKILECIRN